MLESTAYFIINITLHVFLLLSFLTIFFFEIVTKLERQSVNYLLNTSINSGVDKFLTQFSSYKFSSLFNWKELRNIGNNMSKQSVNLSAATLENHKKLLFRSLILLGTVLVILVGLSIYFHKIGITINFKKLIKENFLVFVLLGIIEYLFFKTVASKYVPVTEQNVIDDLIDGLKLRLSTYQKDS